jgi:hypothetical protein
MKTPITAIPHGIQNICRALQYQTGALSVTSEERMCDGIIRFTVIYNGGPILHSEISALTGEMDHEVWARLFKELSRPEPPMAKEFYVEESELCY